MDGDEDGLEVGGEGLVELVVAGGGLAVVLHAVEDAFDHVPPALGDADGPGSPFFGAPAACRWTFTPVGSMAGARISTPMIRSSCNAVNRRSIAPFLDQRLNRWQTVIRLPWRSGGSSTGLPCSASTAGR